MSANFVSQLRTRDVVRLAPEGAPALRVRVEVQEAWDVVRVDATANTPVVQVKQAALQVLQPDAEYHEDFVTKLRGWEILDEGQSLGQAGVLDGSTLLLHGRRKRPVR